jgi:hypothetical protein
MTRPEQVFRVRVAVDAVECVVAEGAQQRPPHLSEIADVAVVHERMAPSAERVAVRFTLAAVLRRRAHVREDQRALHDAREFEQVRVVPRRRHGAEQRGFAVHIGHVPRDPEAIAVQRLFLALAVVALVDDRVFWFDDQRREPDGRTQIHREAAHESVFYAMYHFRAGATRPLRAQLRGFARRLQSRSLSE